MIPAPIQDTVATHPGITNAPILLLSVTPRVDIGVLWPQSSPTLNDCGAGVCLVLQGGKEMIVGNRTLRYGALAVVSRR